jgi:hypothetical protein
MANGIFTDPRVRAPFDLVELVSVCLVLSRVVSSADEVILAPHDDGPLRGNQEAIEFNKKSPNRGMWHFVNLPVGTVSY